MISWRHSGRQRCFGDFEMNMSEECTEKEHGWMQVHDGAKQKRDGGNRQVPKKFQKATFAEFGVDFQDETSKPKIGASRMGTP